MATETPGGPIGAPDPGAGPQSPAGAEAPPAYSGGQIQQQAQVGPRAGFWRRFAAALLDGIMLGILNAILTAGLKGAGYALGIVISIAYFTYFEGGPSGQTVGKRALGIRVIDFDNGGPIGYARGFVRWICRYLSAIPLFLGYFWMLWDGQSQTWHDKLANDVVVPQSAYPVEKWPA
ncbi:MAG: hypothetical protein QOE08_410 [Thermoleophilaceae bacterium]|jgi:uncharacterized RDD family membrane protein YckC|nr:hypothetical protein [Thermoleophilaceae bacterium]